MSAPAGQLDARRVTAVVIGTSAGGVEALSVLLPRLGRGMRAPVLIVLHLPPTRPSLLVEIYQPKCALPVREAQDKDPIEPGTVYFAPPDYHLLVDKASFGSLLPQVGLSVDEGVFFSRPSVDVLFESAAEVYGAGLLGIVLTGANEDGAAGLAAVQRAGGQTIVQDPDTAVAPLMVTAALRRTQPDLVLSVEEIAERLAGLDVEVRRERC